MKPTLIPCTGIESLMRALHDELQGDGLACGVARFRGLFTPERLRASLDQMQRRHAKLRVKIHEIAKRKGAFELVADPPPIPFEIRETDDPLAWETVALAETEKLFGRDEVPLLRVVVLQSPAGGWSDVLLLVHHAIIDGAAMYQLYTELIGPVADAPELLGVERDGFNVQPPRRAYWKRVWHTLQIIRRSLRDRRRVMAAIPYEVEPPGSIVRWVWERDETTRFVARCKREGTTPNGAVGAAALLAGAERYGWGRKWIGVQAPISMRNLAKPPVPADACGCYVSRVAHMLKLPAEVDFWALARNLKQSVVQGMQSDEPWQFLRIINGYLPPPDFYDVRTDVFALNTLGALPACANDGWRMEAMTWFGRARTCGPHMAIMSSSVDGRFNLTLRAERLARASLAAFGEDLLARLRAEF